MTMRYIGGGHKRNYRLIDFKRERDGMKATVKTIEYDPNRSRNNFVQHTLYEVIRQSFYVSVGDELHQHAAVKINMEASSGITGKDCAPTSWKC